ncbi:hypothetical protein ES708_03674 [subsurface metagenome]|uniref:Uncharacterized protein n=1 Tax=marine sediment metagenome TaxID=412755 RepID=X1UHU2_9ZZZZ
MKKQINKEDDVTAPAEIIETPEGISVKEAGRRGGTVTRDRHGVEFYRQIGAKGGESTKRLYGQLFSEFGKLGGRPRRPNLENGAGEGSPKKKEAMVGPGDSSAA